jgi:hypothetical protein
MHIPRLWHMSDMPLRVGDEIPPGRFGRGVIATGGVWDEDQPLPRLILFFFREFMVEHVRATYAPSSVSRLECAFAFECRDLAVFFAAESKPQQPCYEVVPIDPCAPISRHDMTWIDWMGQPGTPPRAVDEACKRYWDGAPIETGDVSRWEWLSSSGLRVIGHA